MSNTFDADLSRKPQYTSLKRIQTSGILCVNLSTQVSNALEVVSQMFKVGKGVSRRPNLEHSQFCSELDIVAYQTYHSEKSCKV